MEAAQLPAVRSVHKTCRTINFSWSISIGLWGGGREGCQKCWSASDAPFIAVSGWKRWSGPGAAAVRSKPPPTVWEGTIQAADHKLEDSVITTPS